MDALISDFSFHNCDRITHLRCSKPPSLWSLPGNQYTSFQSPHALLTGAAGTAGRSPLPWRSGDSELLPLGESSPDGGDKLRSTRGAAEKRPSTFSGNLGFSRKPKKEKDYSEVLELKVPRIPPPPMILEADATCNPPPGPPWDPRHLSSRLHT